MSKTEGIKAIREMAHRERILADARNQQALYRHIKYLRGNDDNGLPRYGLLTLLARRTPFFLYDHPMLTTLATTAFTEGSAVFINNAFFDELAAEDAQNASRGKPTANVQITLLHELKHIALRHIWRLPEKITKLEAEFRNIAEDIFINMRLWKGFDDRLPPGAMFLGDAKHKPQLGFSDDYVQKYWELTEDEIYARVFRDFQQQVASYIKGYQDGMEAQGSSGGSSEPQPQPGGDRPNGFGAADGAEEKEKQAQQEYARGYADGQAGRENRHTIRPEELRERLESAGLKGVADKLGLPEKSDPKAVRAAQERAEGRVKQSLQEAKQARAQNGGKLPGAHIETAVEEAIGELYEPKLRWDVALRQILAGEGNRHAFSEQLPDAVYYQDPGALGVANPIYEGMMLPAENPDVVQVIIDTSGSVSQEQLRRFFSEAFGIVREDETNAPQIKIFSADTAVRGEPLAVTASDWESKLDGLCARGRGGTEFTMPLKGALEHARREGYRVVGVVYFTDTYARPPIWDALPDPRPPIVFVGDAPEAQMNAFRRQIGDHAEVYRIDPEPGARESIVIGASPGM